MHLNVISTAQGMEILQDVTYQRDSMGRSTRVQTDLDGCGGPDSPSEQRLVN